MKGLVPSLPVTEMVPVNDPKRYRQCVWQLIALSLLILCLQHCWGLSQPMCYLYKILSSQNKIDKKPYIVFKGNKVQFQDK